MISHAQIDVDLSTPHQTMVGWEAMSWIAQFDDSYQIDNHHLWKDEVAQLAANEVGINRIRLEVYSGEEIDVDYFSQYIDGQISRQDWKDHWYVPVNDNNDPFMIDWNGFHFSKLDYTIAATVLPLKNAVEANGEELYVNLNYVDFGGSPFNHIDDPDEYGEFILAVFLHMDATHGFVPDGVEVILEPDLADDWRSWQRVRDALVAAAVRLEGAGYSPDFIAPSNTNMTAALDYFDQMIGDSQVQQYISELSYHRYSGVNNTTLMAIADRGVQYGIGTSMLEWWSSANGQETLHEDLVVGRNTAWQPGVLAGIGTPDNGPGLFKIDTSDPLNPQVLVNTKTRYLRQYFQFVRRGAIRVEATTQNGSYQPVAFVNVDGRAGCVVDAGASGPVTISGMPEGNYGLRYASASSYEVTLPNQVIGEAESIAVTLPEPAVLVVHGLDAPTAVESIGLAERAAVFARPNPSFGDVTIEWTPEAYARFTGEVHSTEWQVSIHDAAGRTVWARQGLIGASVTVGRSELLPADRSGGLFFWRAASSADPDGPLLGSGRVVLR